MMIRSERTREGLLIVVEGRLDSYTAEVFRKEVVAEIGGRDGATVMDLAAVTFVSSAGLRALLMIARSEGVEVRLCCLLPEVRAVFTMSGFDRLLTIFESREEALR